MNCTDNLPAARDLGNDCSQHQRQQAKYDRWPSWNIFQGSSALKIPRSLSVAWVRLFLSHEVFVKVREWQWLKRRFLRKHLFLQIHCCCSVKHFFSSFLTTLWDFSESLRKVYAPTYVSFEPLTHYLLMSGTMKRIFYTAFHSWTMPESTACDERPLGSLPCAECQIFSHWLILWLASNIAQ